MKRIVKIILSSLIIVVALLLAFNTELWWVHAMCLVVAWAEAMLILMEVVKWP